MSAPSFAEIAKSLPSRDFWTGLTKDLHIGDADYIKAQPVFNIEPQAIERLKELVKREGYFQADPPQWNLPLEGMIALTHKLTGLGIPTPFVFIYDEFWMVFTKIGKIIEGLLGKGFQRLPDFWAWHIEPEKEQSGWSPHRDKGVRALFPDRSPKSLTVWVPLTASTPLNGCIYLVPADRDPTYATPEEKQFRFALSDIRALPAAPGSILCWSQAVLHWGSHACSREKRPRISLAYEFQSGEVPPFNKPLMNPYTVPDFTSRLKLVAKQILQYQHMYKLQDDIKTVAEKLIR
ncbi:MAG TPA: phytanoyl-CoA dioxygenase family protein [Sphingomonadales bacterium]|nr:phytanoyl-CoA dioxygenase family protein [Sphingomonadales bacterium]